MWHVLWAIAALQLLSLSFFLCLSLSFSFSLLRDATSHPQWQCGSRITRKEKEESRWNSYPVIFDVDPHVRDFHARAILCRFTLRNPSTALDALLDVTHERCEENLGPFGQSIDCLKNRIKKRVRRIFLFSMLICALDKVMSEARSRVLRI